uniref:Uncharacterized protein n=1 Tax=Anguilla anguilla TaxID=7936 RepID=A0A0E9W8J2_ANGAN
MSTFIHMATLFIILFSDVLLSTLLIPSCNV